MGWKDQQGNPVTDPGLIQQLELADQGQQQSQSQQGLFSRIGQRLMEGARTITDPIARGYAVNQGEGQNLQEELGGPPSKLSLAGSAAGFMFPGTTAGGVIGQAVSPEIGIPGVVGGLLGAGAANAPGLIRAGRKLAQLPWMRQERTAQAAGALGRETDPAIRAAEAEQPIRDAYKAAESVVADVPTGNIKATVRRVISQGSIDEEAASELLQKTQRLGNTTSYKDLVDLEQNLTTTGYSNATNAKMKLVKDAIVEATRGVNPALAKANALTAHTYASEEILRTINISKNAQDALSKIQNLFSSDPHLVRSLGLNNPQAMEYFQGLVRRGAGPDVIKATLQRMGHMAPWIGLGYMGGHYGGQ